MAGREADETILRLLKEAGILARILVKWCHEQSKLENGKRVRRHHL